MNTLTVGMGVWCGVTVGVFVLASGQLSSIWVADISVLLSEEILGEQRAPTFAWIDKKVCRQERERESRLERKSLQYASSN